MLTLAQPQPVRAIHRPFKPPLRQGVAENLQGLCAVHSKTPTNDTPTRSFPIDNLIFGSNEEGRCSVETSSRYKFESDVLYSTFFVGCNPVEVGSGEAMTFVVACNGQVGGRLRIGKQALSAIAAPSAFEDLSLNAQYIDSACIFWLLRLSVERGRPLSILPFCFDGSFLSENPLLKIGDWVLSIVYDDAVGDLLCMLDDRIIPPPAVV